MSTVAERVAAGVEWLDANMANWEDRVSMVRFDIDSTCDCVLGQVYADRAEYGYAWAVYQQNVMTRSDAVARGFDYRSPYDEEFDGDEEKQYMALQEEWERVITERKAARLDEWAGVLVDSPA